MPKERGRKDERKATATRTTASAVAAEAAVPLSDPQELSFLPRREGRVWTVVEVDRAVRDARELLVDADADAGKRIWRFGDKALELYNGLPERSKGYPSFIAFACVAFDRSREDLYEALRVRRRVESAEAAGKLGRAKLQLGFRLLDRLGLETLEALAARELPLPDGSSCRFPATVRQLSAALKLLAVPADASPSKTPRRFQVEASRKNEALKLAKLEDADLAGVRARFVPRDGDVFLETSPLSGVQRIALAKLILKLEDT
jgi:hypothetical protein